MLTMLRNVRFQDGVERLVNLVTPSTNVIVLLNAQSPANYQFFAYSLFSYLASPGVMSDMLLLDPQLGALTVTVGGCTSPVLCHNLQQVTACKVARACPAAFQRHMYR